MVGEDEVATSRKVTRGHKQVKSSEENMMEMVTALDSGKSWWGNESGLTEGLQALGTGTITQDLRQSGWTHKPTKLIIWILEGGICSGCCLYGDCCLVSWRQPQHSLDTPGISVTKCALGLSGSDDETH